MKYFINFKSFAVEDIAVSIKTSLVLCAWVMLCFGCNSPSRDISENFEIHPDFTLRLVAAEPLVLDPVDMQFDELGRAYVLEMPGYPLRDAPSRLICLKDEDDDGIFDTREVFSEDLGVATSFMPYKEGFLVASPPQLITISDTDGDGREDVRKVLMDGFSDGNLQHNFNAITYGLDNWIYAANGGNSGTPFFKDRPGEALDLRGMDIRLDLENKKLVRIGESSGGFQLTFDEWGRIFETHNMEHISHLVFEDRYIDGLPTDPRHTLANISDHEEKGTSRVYPLGEQESRVNHPEQAGYFSGACGITHYGGGLFPENFDSAILVADCVLNLVHLDTLSQNGASFSAGRVGDKKEFLASTDRSFRPVNMSVGPRGAIYLLDMHRDVIEHPEWIPDELEVQIDLKAGREKGRIYRIAPKNSKLSKMPVLDVENSETLVKALSHKNQWVRTTAQRLLVTYQKKEAAPLLENELQDAADPLARLHALWTLEGLKALSDQHLMRALQDETKGILESALKISETRMEENRSIFDAVLQLTHDSNHRVRMQAILAVAQSGDRQNEVTKNGVAETMWQVLSDAENDRWTSQAIAAAVKDRALDFSRRLLKEGALVGGAPDQMEVLRTLVTFIGKKGNPEVTSRLLQDLDLSHKNSDLVKILVLNALHEGWNLAENRDFDKGSRMQMARSLSKLEKEGQPGVLKASGSLRQELGLEPSPKIMGIIEKTKSDLFDQNLSTRDRVERLELLGLSPFKNRETLLYRALDNREPQEIQGEALRQLSESDDPGVATKLIELWPNLAPQARREASDILLYKAENHDALVTAMEAEKIKPGELNLDLERRRVLLHWGTDEIRKRAEALFSDAGVVRRKDAIEAMKPALALKGDRSNGKEVFSAVCAQCHRYGDLGVEVGPSLTEAKRKSKEALMYDILDPNAAVDTEYLNYQVKTKAGAILTGLIANESDREITLRMMGGKETTIAKDAIENMSSNGASMMFEGLEVNMDHQEMADLLMFLQQ